MRRIKLSNGLITLVDDINFLSLSVFKWHFLRSKKNNFYAYRSKKKNGKQKNTLMHRQILNVTKKEIQIDHINGNGLDNRIANLRICSHLQNCRNKRVSMRIKHSKFKGVGFHKSAKNKIRAYIMHNGKQKHLGYFPSEKSAALAYNKSAMELFGLFANLNDV